MLPPAMCLALS